jgi:hypothetical protein
MVACEKSSKESFEGKKLPGIMMQVLSGVW